MKCCPVSSEAYSNQVNGTARMPNAQPACRQAGAKCLMPLAGVEWTGSHRKESDMFETADRLMLAGLGALSMTRERAEKLFEDMVGRGQAAKEARTGFVRDVMDAAEKTRKDFERTINEQVEAAVKRLDLPTREDIHRLEAKLDKVLKAAKGT